MIQFDFGVAPWDLIVMTYIQSLAARDGERILRFEDVDAFPDWNSRKKSAWSAWWWRSTRSNISS